MINGKKVCVVIPCFKVKKEIKNVLKKINYKLVDKVFLIDDACPEKSGIIAKGLNLKKVEVIFSKKNLGVGGATMLGFKKALTKNYEFIFKIDGDGQHNPSDIRKFLNILQSNKYNYCKGTRFINKRNKYKIPKIRLFGNIILTFMSRLTCGNSEITDVVNGFLCIRARLLKKLDFQKISNDFFFEEDLLFNVSFFEKNIKEVHIETIYNNKSSLNPIKTILPFILKHLRNLILRLIYKHEKNRF